jgi:formylglycine-generating enzyme required for sulfatase activity
MTYLLALLFISSSSMSGATYKIDKPMVVIPAGIFLMGSLPDEREYGYRLDEDRKSFASRKYKWFESEKRRKVDLKSYSIDIHLVTNKDYSLFVKATGGNAPFVDQKTWDGYHLVHSYKEVDRFLWKEGVYPKGREEHPVVLVGHADAEASMVCMTWRGRCLNGHPLAPNAPGNILLKVAPGTITPA